jgi:hypothetical protein
MVVAALVGSTVRGKEATTTAVEGG